MTLEKRKEDFNSKIIEIEKIKMRRSLANSILSNAKAMDVDSDDSDDGGDDEVGDIDEYLDWRSKKAYK